MSLIDTVPAGLAKRLSVFTFGPIPGMTGYTFNEDTNLGGIFFHGASNLTSFSAPNLVSIDPSDTQAATFDIQDCPLTTLSLPLLQTIGDFLSIQRTALTSLSFPSLVTAGGAHGIAFIGNSSLTSVSMPALTTVTGQIELDSMPNLITFRLPSLFTVGDRPPEGGLVSVSGMTGLTTIDLPVCQHIGGYFQMSGCTALTTVNVPNWLPTNGTNISFANSPLNVTSVNLILHQCAQSGAFVSGTVNLAGAGAAAPTGQGVADKATLVGRGVTVFTN